MTDHLTKHRAEMTQQAWPAVEHFVQGFAAGTGSRLGPQDLAASRAFAHFLVWRSISDYGDWHGEPLAAVEMADVVEKAVDHRREIELYNSSYSSQ